MLVAENQFEQALRRRLPAITIRPELPSDGDFLEQLFIACSPMDGILPEPMLRQQAMFQQIGHQTEFPDAMRRIVMLGDRDVGRIVLDWSGAGSCLCVDIAIMPSAQRGGIGSHLLAAWIEVADALGRPCSLQVTADNPAWRIYGLLGFVPREDGGQQGPIVDLTRPVTPQRA